MVGQSSGTLTTRVEPWCSTYFLDFFIEKVGYTHMCTFGGTARFSKSLNFLLCVYMDTHACVCSVSVECVDCVHLVIPDKKQIDM